MDRFVIDLERLKAPYSGLGQFCRDLGNAILERAPHHGFAPVLLLPDKCKHLWNARAKCISTTWWRRKAATHWLSLLPEKARRWSVDKAFSRPAIWHATHHQSRFGPPTNDIPVVVTIHDMKFLHVGNRRSFARKLKRMQDTIDRSAAVATISQAVRRDIEQHLDLRGKQIHVIHNAPYPTDGIISSPPPRAFSAPFLFSIGFFEPKKNFETLVAMLEFLPELHLVIAGDDSTPYGKQIRQMVERVPWRNRIRLLGTVSDGERQWLYQKCTAFVFPSLAEGFGLPVLEAMNAGRAVVLSDRTSLPEVGGPLATYWREFDPRSMAKVVRDALQKLERDPTLVSDFREWAGRFSWTQAADKYLKLYRSTLDSRSSMPRRAAA